MRITRCAAYEDLSERAATVIVEIVTGNPEANLCLATGASPLGAYRSATSRADFTRVSITKLDEWLGIGSRHPGSCEAFLQREVLIPWQIDPSRYLSFNADTADPAAECARVEQALRPFDLIILGVGANGHLAMNEPADEWIEGPHVAELTEQTLSHSMLDGGKPTGGMTMGMGDILRSKRVLLLVVGEHKRPALEALTGRRIRTPMPVSGLVLHANVTCLSCLS